MLAVLFLWSSVAAIAIDPSDTTQPPLFGEITADTSAKYIDSDKDLVLVTFDPKNIEQQVSLHQSKIESIASDYPSHHFVWHNEGTAEENQTEETERCESYPCLTAIDIQAGDQFHREKSVSLDKDSIASFMEKAQMAKAESVLKESDDDMDTDDELDFDDLDEGSDEDEDFEEET